MRGHPIDTAEGREAVRALVGDPAVLSEALRALARRTGRIRAQCDAAWTSERELRAEHEAMLRRARDVRDGRVEELALGDGEQAELVVDVARYILGEEPEAAGTPAAEQAVLTPQDVVARLEMARGVAARLEPQLMCCAAALEAAARRPGLVSSDPGAEPGGLARHAAFLLARMGAGQYLSGLVEQLATAEAAVATLSESLEDGRDSG